MKTIANEWIEHKPMNRGINQLIEEWINEWENESIRRIH